MSGQQLCLVWYKSPSQGETLHCGPRFFCLRSGAVTDLRHAFPILYRYPVFSRLTCEIFHFRVSKFYRRHTGFRVVSPASNSVSFHQRILLFLPLGEILSVFLLPSLAPTLRRALSDPREHAIIPHSGDTLDIPSSCFPGLTTGGLCNSPWVQGPKRSSLGARASIWQELHQRLQKEQTRAPAAASSPRSAPGPHSSVCLRLVETTAFLEYPQSSHRP